MIKNTTKEKSYLFFLTLSNVILWENVHTFSLILLAPYENPYVAKVCPLLGLCFTENFRVHALTHLLPAWLSQAFHTVGTSLRLEINISMEWLCDDRLFSLQRSNTLYHNKLLEMFYEPRQSCRARFLESYTLSSLLQNWKFAARGWRPIWILGMAKADAWKRFGRAAGWNRV